MQSDKSNIFDGCQEPTLTVGDCSLLENIRIPNEKNNFPYFDLPVGDEEDSFMMLTQTDKLKLRTK